MSILCSLSNWVCKVSKYFRGGVVCDCRGYDYGLRREIERSGPRIVGEERGVQCWKGWDGWELGWVRRYVCI